jgi:hypothetical protein
MKLPKSKSPEWQAAVETLLLVVELNGPTMMACGGGGMRANSEDQPHALGYAPSETLRSTNAQRKALPVASDGKR